MIADSGSSDVAALGDVADDNGRGEEKGHRKSPDSKGHDHWRNCDVLEVENQRGNQSESRNDGNDDCQPGNKGHGF